MNRNPIPGLERKRDIQTSAIRMPAEWEPQDALLFIWPHPDNGWQDLHDVEAVFIDLVTTTGRHQHVVIVCQDDSHKKHVSRLVSTQLDSDQYLLVIAPTNDCWVRDTGPISIIENERVKLLNFQFNGWGNKYAHEKDNLMNTELSKQSTFKCSMQSVQIILEGGSIETDGNGTLLTTRNCLLSKQRNPQYSEKKLGKLFGRLLGIDNVHWLNHGSIAGDDTDSHIDTLARFCPNNTIAYSMCSDHNDINYEPLRLMEVELRTLHTKEKTQYTLVALPLPKAIINSAGNRLPATYVNFQIINTAVLCPQYNDPNDRYAIKQLRNIFPDREIVGINSLPIIEQYGSLHCLCMSLYSGTTHA